MVMAARALPLTVVAASGQVLGHRGAAGRAVAVEVLEAHQERAGAFGRAEHARCRGGNSFGHSA